MANVNFEKVTEQFISALEKGVAPWQQPWASSGGVRNASGRRYSGINIFLLNIAALANGWTSPFWVTFKKAGELKDVEGNKASVKKGEKGNLVVFWSLIKTKEKDTKTGDFKTIPFLRTYYVFNVEQTTIDPKYLPKLPEFDNSPIQRAEEIIAGFPTDPKLTVKHGGDQASYTPSTDVLRIPALKQFKSAEGYYATFFHELIHATGHKGRLDRSSKGNRFGDNAYAYEELVAELGGAFLANEAGILPHVTDNSASYLAGWVKVLRAEPSILISAASAATKAVNFITDDSAEEEIAEEAAA